MIKIANDFGAFVKEVTFGTKPALTNVEFSNILSETLRGSREFELERGTFYLSHRDPIPTRFTTSGSMRWQLGPENGIGKSLQAMFGADTASDPGIVGSTIRHVWNDASPPAAPPSMSILMTRAFQLGQFEFLGQICSRIRFEAVPNQSVRTETEWMGDFEQIASAPDSPTVPVQVPFISHESDWRIGTTPGTTEPRVEGWSLELSRDTEITPRIDQIRGRRVYAAGLDVTGRADIDFDTLLYYRRFFGSDTTASPEDSVTIRNVEIEMISAANAAPEAGFPYRLAVRLPKIVFEAAEANQTGRDRIVGGFPFRAYTDTALGYSIQITLDNTRSTTFYS